MYVCVCVYIYTSLSVFFALNYDVYVCIYMQKVICMHDIYRKQILVDGCI